MGFKPFSNIPYSIYYALQVTEANKVIKKMEELQQSLTDEIIWAQSIYKAIVNKKQTLVLVY